MNPFAVLRTQVKKCLVTETTLEVEQRAIFDWSFAANVGGKLYVVGKTGANTCYYKLPGSDQAVACYPDELLDHIDSWGKSKYVAFTICHKKFDRVVLDNLKTVEQALKAKPKKFKPGLFICGITNKGKRVKLYRLKEGLSGSAWTPVEKV